MTSTRKKILFFFIICFCLLITSLYYSVWKSGDSSNQNQSETPKTNYKKNIRIALDKIDEANGAIIYKDYDKALELLDQAHENIQKIGPQNELFKEAQEIENSIQQKQLEIKTIKQGEEAQKPAEGDSMNNNKNRR
ncbi:MAG: hypothetical protein GF347_02070 [Candidatus Moranbacteria bacterium]|nr:hypothetical protein [Candidatus Moranbacteria bacterium]